jgi:hypothetical protein
VRGSVLAEFPVQADKEIEIMPKIVGTRERVHQPFYDSLIRVDGSTDLRTNNLGAFGAVQARSQLFLRTGADLAISNLTTGGFFPSDQTFVTLAVRVWTYFRANLEAQAKVGDPTTDYPIANFAAAGGSPGLVQDLVMRVHKLYHQSENQLFWQLQAGDKPQLTTFTAYTPFAGGLDGFFADSRLPRANNGVPTSSALMRLARPVLIPPRQGFQVIAQASAIGQTVGASLTEQLNGLVPNNTAVAFITSGGADVNGFGTGTGISVAGRDQIEKDIKYLIDGIHSRDVL